MVCFPGITMSVRLVQRHIGSGLKAVLIYKLLVEDAWEGKVWHNQMKIIMEMYIHYAKKNKYL